MEDKTPTKPAAGLLPKDVVKQRHPVYSLNAILWQFYSDHYIGGALWPFKANPLVQSSPSANSQDIAVGGPNAAGQYGATRYLWQYSLEKTAKFLHRVARCCYINIVAPVVDFYAATIGKPENIFITRDPNLAQFEDNCDLQGQSFLQFMLRARSTAAVFGHTFLLVDSTSSATPIVTEADAQAAGIRPYLLEITPEHMLNWRLDAFGQPIELIFRTPVEVAGSVLDSGSQVTREQFRYWNRTGWVTYQEDEAGAIVEISRGDHKLGLVPVVCLYHKRDRAWMGVSLLKDAAKLGQLATNWVSSLDEAFETQMFAIPVWKSKTTPTDAAVGSATVMHLNPDDNEEFSYVTPDTQPFSEGWDAFYRIIQLANKHMGIAGKAITGGDKIEQQSGIAKQWDFFEAEKVLSSMAVNEQEAALNVFSYAAQWLGKPYTGSIQYATKYDLSTATEDINDLIALQAAGVTKTARQELLRRIIQKKLPSVSDEVAKKISDEIDAMADYVDPLIAAAAQQTGINAVDKADPEKRAIKQSALEAEQAAGGKKGGKPAGGKPN